MCYYFQLTKNCSIPYEVLCHCERSVAISRKGNRIVMIECVAKKANITRIKR